jgi:hypothetical protein
MILTAGRIRIKSAALAAEMSFCWGWAVTRQTPFLSAVL